MTPARLSELLRDVWGQHGEALPDWPKLIPMCAEVLERALRDPDDERVATMCGLELVLDVAYHDAKDSRELAVAAEAWELAGYSAAAIDVSHASPAQTWERVEAARRGRHRRLLRHGGRGLLFGLIVLGHHGILTCGNAMEAKRLRWLDRGGHGR